ncbi:MAG: discoidin domain-containing protein, partial [Balneolaceae bacterium]
TTIFGDPNWWGDYKVSTDIMLEESGYVELISRITSQSGLRISGYHFQISSSGSWKLYREDIGLEEDVLASGNTVFGIGEWHNLALEMQGQEIALVINGDTVDTINDETFTTGQAALTVSSWHNAQFDNVEITPLGDWPVYLSGEGITARATSDQPGNQGGRNYIASRAIDGRPETYWHTEYLDNKRPLPQSITLDLGGSYEVEGLTYQPRIDGQRNGMITSYDILISNDGATYSKVASGNWPTGTSVKTAIWEKRKARYVKLEATQAVNENVSAGEIRIVTDNLATHTEPAGTDKPSEFSLKQNYPNPFNPKTNIEYSVSRRVNLSLKIYDSMGRLVKTLVDNKLMSPGNYKVVFDGSQFASGTYFYRIEADEFTQTRKLILIK